MSTVNFGKEFNIGCGDNSCRFGSRGGMATNGGCRCDGEKEPRRTQEQLLARGEARTGIAALRTIAASPAILAGLRMLIAAAVTAEREACAELVDAAVMAAYERGVMADPERSRFVRVAAAIRARGQS